MTMQLLVEANESNIRTLQLLPTMFTEMLKPKNNWLYLIHNRGTKHKVYIKMAGGNQFKLYGSEWREFLDVSKYTNISTLHFIRQEEDCYYVTAYNNSGYECNGYDLARVGNRQRRCLLTLEQVDQSPDLPCGFLTSTENPQFRVYVNGTLVSTVTRREIKLVDEDKHVHVFGGMGWHILVQVQNLVVGRILVFTNLLNNSVSMMPFYSSGLEIRHDMVEHKIMSHMCEWEGHREHQDEKNCFYAPILAYVTERSRLNISHDFEKARKMWKYQNAILRYVGGMEFYVDVDIEHHSDRPKSKNHVTMNCRWRDVVHDCHWEANKMVQFKLVDCVPDVRASLASRKKVVIPVFHMC